MAEPVHLTVAVPLECGGCGKVGTSFELDVPAELAPGSLRVPLEAVCRSCGRNVIFGDVELTVTG